MKLTRLLALVLTLSLSLSLLAGCSTTESNDVTVPQVETEATPPELDAEPPVLTPEAGEEELPVAPLPEDEVDPAPSGDIALSRSDFTLFTVGDSYQLTLSNLIATDTVAFSSANEEVATVSEDGTVTAVGAGTTTIVATILLDGITAVDRTAIVRCDIEIPQVEEDVESTTITVADFFAQLMADFTSTGTLMPFEGEMLTGAYPGLADVNTLQCMVYAPMMTFSAMELALVEVADSADVDTVKAIFQARIDAQVAGGAWYPAAIEGWQNHSHIVTSGNYVFMVVTSGYQDGVDAPITETAQEFIDAFEAAF